MHIDNGSAPIRLVIPGLFEGDTKRVGDQVAFVAQVTRAQSGPRDGRIDGDPVRLMVGPAPGQEAVRFPMMIATIVSEDR